jgi:uncharacterized membrane protein
MHDQIIVAVFPSRRVLLKALDHLLEEVGIDVQQAAVVAKSSTGKILVLNDDLGGTEGGWIGGAVGSVGGAVGVATLGALTLPGLDPLLVVLSSAALGGGVGWLVGQITARAFNVGFAGRYANAIADKLQTGHAALMLHVEDAAALLPRLQAELKPYRAELVEQLREYQSNITP